MLTSRYRATTAVLGLLLSAAANPLIAQPAPSSNLRPAKELITAMLASEDAASLRKEHYAYHSEERSDRTSGHLWSEKVVETNAGKVRMLIAEDGQPLAADRAAAERGRLAGIVADPAGFAKREQALRNDETHAKQMLSLLPKAYLLGEVQQQGGFLHIDFRPDPQYSPQSLEERVLHGMSGSLLIEPHTLRLHEVEGRLPADISIGFGILATIRAGSSFATLRDPVGPGLSEWKTHTIDTNIDGKAIFFKVIAKKQHAVHTSFARVPDDITVAQAVELVEQ